MSTLRSTSDKWYWVNNEFLDRGFTPEDIAVYNVMARYANNQTQTCFPQQDKFEKMIGINSNTLNHIIEKLHRLQWIEVTSSDPLTFRLLRVPPVSVQSKATPTALQLWDCIKEAFDAEINRPTMLAIKPLELAEMDGKTLYIATPSRGLANELNVFQHTLNRIASKAAGFTVKIVFRQEQEPAILSVKHVL